MRESRVEGTRIYEALESALKKDGSMLLSEDERTHLQAENHRLAVAIKSHDADFIRQVTDEVAKASESFASRRMNAGIREALSGHSVDDFVKQSSTCSDSHINSDNHINSNSDRPEE